MKCPESESLLQRRLDGEAVADHTALESHLAECAECRDRFTAASRLVDEGLPALRRLESPGPTWTSQVIADLLADYRRRCLLAYRIRLLASAAALVAAVLGGWALLRNAIPGAPTQNVEARREPRVKPSPVPAVEPSLQSSVAEAEQAVKSLGNRIADNTVGPVWTLLAVSSPAEVGPMPSLPTVASIEEPLDPAARSLQETGRGVSAGIQSVTSSARRAFDFLLREMPAVSLE
jgi:hypothetical protein